MKETNVLYISGSLGRGHITRDIAIVAELRKLIPEIEIEWFVVDPATLFLKEAERNSLIELSIMPM
jgi:hypothetical protein